MEETSERFIIADVLEGLAQIESDSVQVVVTSPPYWGLRDYGTDGQLGLERTPGEYVEKLVAVFREVRRVLRPDGTLWLNLGDCHATGAGKVGDAPGGGDQGARWKGPGGRTLKGGHDGLRGPSTQPNRMPLPGLKAKDLVGIPWRVAFALQADGWTLRSDIVWSKPNPMPESVLDRPTRSHEFVFLFSRSERYFYDSAAISEPTVGQNHHDLAFHSGYQAPGQRIHSGDRRRSGNTARKMGKDRGAPEENHRGGSIPWEDLSGRRNRRSVWTIQVKPYSGAHYAVFPENLVKPCVLAGSRRGDTVLDPFFGSGTTAVVARRFGRSFVGIDLNPENERLALDRLAAVSLPLPFPDLP